MEPIKRKTTALPGPDSRNDLKRANDASCYGYIGSTLIANKMWKDFDHEQLMNWNQ